MPPLQPRSYFFIVYKGTPQNVHSLLPNLKMHPSHQYVQKKELLTHDNTLRESIESLAVNQLIDYTNTKSISHSINQLANQPIDQKTKHEMQMISEKKSTKSDFTVSAPITNHQLSISQSGINISSNRINRNLSTHYIGQSERCFAKLSQYSK